MLDPVIVRDPILDATRRRVILSSYWMSTLADGASRIIIPLYLARIGVPAASIGVTFLFFELFSLLASVGAGFLLNRVGYKRALLSSLALHTLTSFGYLLIFPELALWVLMVIVTVLRAANGIAKELIKTASTAYFKVLVDEAPQKDRRSIQLLLGGKDGMKGFGMLVGGILLVALDFRLAFGVLGLPILVFFVLSLKLLDDHAETQRVEFRGFLDVRLDLAYLSLSRAFLYAGRDLWLVVPVPLYLKSIGYSDLAVAALFAMSLIVFGVVQPLAVRELMRKDRRWPFRTAAVAAPLMTLLIPVGLLLTEQGALPLIVGIFGFNVLAAFATMPHNHLHLKYARKNRAAVDIAFYKTGAQIGKLLAVPASGVLYGLYGLGPCLVASAVSLSLSSLSASMMSTKGSVSTPAVAGEAPSDLEQRSAGANH